VRPLRVALVGYGLAGRVLHRPLLQAEPGFVLTHVITADVGRRAQAQVDVPGVIVLDTAPELWARAGEIDLVVIAAPHPVHAELAAAALQAGLATVVDKPLAATAEQARRLLALAQQRGLALSVFANRRWDSDTLTAARLIADGTLGKVSRLESRFTRFRPQVEQRWRERPDAAGGVLLDLGPHLVDAALLLLGPVTQVYAEIGLLRSGAAVDDDCFLALTHAGGAHSHLWGSLAAPWPGPRLVLQGSRAGWSKDDLDGQEAALRAGAQAGPVAEPPGRLVDAAGSRQVPSLPGDWSAYYRLLHVALSAGGPLPVTAQDGVHVLEVLEAAQLAARDGQVVQLM